MRHPERALELCDQALAAFELAGDSRLEEQARALSNRGSLRVDMGDIEGGKADLARCLELVEGLPGVDAAIAHAFANSYLGTAAQAEGDDERAAELFLEAINEKAAIFGSEWHPSVQWDVESLAKVAERSGDHRRHCEAELRVAQLRQGIYGEGERGSQLAVKNAEAALERFRSAEGFEVAAGAELEEKIASLKH